MGEDFNKNFYSDNINSSNYSILELEELIENKNHEIKSLENKIKYKNNKILNLKKVNKNLSEVKDEVDLLENEIRANKKKISKLNKSNKKLKKEKKALISSLSWKITSPIRKFKFFIKKISNKFKKSKTTSKKNKTSSSKSNKKNKKSKKKEKISTIENIYDKLYCYHYYFKTYIRADNYKRINLFFDNIDGSINEFKNLFSFLIDYCESNAYDLRIIYNNADFEEFNQFLNNNNIVLKDNVTFLNFKDDNYLDIGLDEKFVCTSWKSAKSLINTYTINSVVYFYLGDLNECTPEECLQIYNICYYPNVVILYDDIVNLNKIKKIDYDYEINANKKTNKGDKLLCIDFNERFIEAIEFLNYLFFNSIIDIDEWDIYMISKNINSTFYLNFDLKINTISEKLNDMDLFIQLGSKEYDSDIHDYNYIKLDYKKINDNNYKCLDINNNDFDTFDSFVPVNVRRYDPSNSLIELFIKIMEIK